MRKINKNKTIARYASQINSHGVKIGNLDSVNKKIRKIYNHNEIKAAIISPK
jgi:hypothetical protein